MSKVNTTMYLVTFFLYIFVAIVLGEVSPDEIHKVCSKIDKGDALRCCKMDSIVTSKRFLDPSLRECLELPTDSCERVTCTGMKMGYITAEGKLDKAKITQIAEEDFSAQSDIVSGIKEKCVNADVSKYGLPEQCEMVKHSHCMQIQIIGHCDNWDTEGDCADIKKAAEDCLKYTS